MNAILRDSYCALRPPRAVRDAHVRRGESTSSSTPAPARGHAHARAAGRSSRMRWMCQSARRDRETLYIDVQRDEMCCHTVRGPTLET